MNFSKSILLFLLIVVITVLLPLLNHWSNDVIIFKTWPAVFNKQLVYQTITLLMALGLLAVLKCTKPLCYMNYYGIGNIDAPIDPVPIIGICADDRQNWLRHGREFALVISVVTFVIIYFQVIKGHESSLTKLVYVLPFSIMFSLTNSFVEEVITRLGIVVAFKNVLSDRAIPFVSATVFGVVHYWGLPGGLPGVMASGFLAWFLAKSILETNGIFWAWIIHFVQDIIIFTAFFIVS